MSPSLKLPDPVMNLSATRSGKQVSLSWTMPKKNTDKLPIKGNIQVRMCRKQETTVCEPVPDSLSFAPGVKAAFTDNLPPELVSGAPRALTYYVELISPHGRSAGLSNAAPVVAGEAPGQVAGFSAQLRKDGAVLHWTPDATAVNAIVIRLHRTLLTPAPTAGSAGGPGSRKGLLAPPTEPIEQSLLVEDAAQPGVALDKTIRFGQTYEYRAQRVARVSVEGQTVELAGPLSEPIRIDAVDIFPPVVPTGLAAVATAVDSGAGASIDLSWLPISEADLAGYAVYRREGQGEWLRISPPQPVIGPAFHDAQVNPGHKYHYEVTAIDQQGHESTRSLEAEETVPNP